MKSNYLKTVAPVVEKTEEDAETGEDKEATKDEPAEKTPEELEHERKERIASAMHRARHAAVSFIPLQTEAIYDIF